MLYVATTFKYVFDFHPEDVFWCTADIGWITGHSYVTYGPLANGATSVLVRWELGIDKILLGDHFPKLLSLKKGNLYRNPLPGERGILRGCVSYYDVS